MKSPSLLASFRFAFEGIGYAFRTQRNFKIHCLVTVCVAIAGLALQVSLEQWVLLALAVGLVFQAELANTAIESITDRASPEHHPLAKVTKDCAAAGVMVSALVAAIVGALILGPRILALLTR